MVIDTLIKPCFCPPSPKSWISSLCALPCYPLDFVTLVIKTEKKSVVLCLGAPARSEIEEGELHLEREIVSDDGEKKNQPHGTPVRAPKKTHAHLLGPSVPQWFCLFFVERYLTQCTRGHNRQKVTELDVIEDHRDLRRRKQIPSDGHCQWIAVRHLFPRVASDLQSPYARQQASQVQNTEFSSRSALPMTSHTARTAHDRKGH